MEPRLTDRLRFVWTVFPGVDLVAFQAPGMVAVFYMLGSRDVPIRTWKIADLVARRDATGLALTVGQAYAAPEPGTKILGFAVTTIGVRPISI